MMKLKTFLLFVFCSLFFVRQTQAATAYPISSLGNCRDGQECKLYCQIPANTPACWSYGKYILNNDVLGEATTNITYPIADLGNCATAQECFLYCAQPKNQESCISYAKNNGLVKDDEEDDSLDKTKKQELITAAKEELGCDGKEACMALCDDPANMDKCRAFAKKHNLEKEHAGPPVEVLEKAKTALGCDSETTCANICQKEENREKCYEFAKEHKLLKEPELKRYEEVRESGKQMLEAAKTELGCDSKESCRKLCSDSENQEKCSAFGRKMGVEKSQLKTQSAGGFGGINKSTLPCTSETECKAYCQSHPDQCPGASGRPNANASDTALSRPKDSTRPGEFLGPSGCKTEEECKSYCQNHPDSCPGFPNTLVTPKPSMYQIQPGSKTEKMETREIKPTEYEKREDKPIANPDQ